MPTDDLRPFIRELARRVVDPDAEWPVIDLGDGLGKRDSGMMAMRLLQQVKALLTVPREDRETFESYREARRQIAAELRALRTVLDL